MGRAYYELVKPGIIYGNLIPTAGAFLFASYSEIDWILCIATLFGLALVIASASVFNNYADREMDARMERTKHRALAAGIIPEYKAIIFGAPLGLAGASLLYNVVSPLTFAVAFVGWFTYVMLYTPLKPRTPYALFVGAVAGATPPVVGYVAAAGVLDTTALILFLALFVWQLPHFVAIAVFRYEEYLSAGVPLFIKNPPTELQKKRARMVFVYSLIVLLLFSLTLAIAGIFGLSRGI